MRRLILAVILAAIVAFTALALSACDSGTTPLPTIVKCGPGSTITVAGTCAP